MQDFVRVGVADATEQARMVKARLSEWFSRVSASVNFIER